MFAQGNIKSSEQRKSFFSFESYTRYTHTKSKTSTQQKNV